MDRDFLQHRIIASNDYTRSRINCVNYNKAARRLEATNGHALAVVPCEPENADHAGRLSLKAFAAAKIAKGSACITARKTMVDVCDNGNISNVLHRLGWVLPSRVV